MYWLFLICALVGGTIFILQFVLAVAGSGVDDLDLGQDMPHDIPHDVPHHLPGHGDHGHGSTWMFGVISFRTVVAALTFFGLAGLASLSAEISPPLSLIISCAAGAGALYGVHFLMQSLYRLRHDGTAQIHRTLGERGTVYVPIPANRGGLGKIQIRTQGRIMEYAAQTGDPQRLKTGTTVVVKSIVSPMTVEVEPLAASAPEAVATNEGEAP
jgi:membrane protein implicated in regulation of membrane protease activity